MGSNDPCRCFAHAFATSTSPHLTASHQAHPLVGSRFGGDILCDGDVIGPGLSILGQPIAIVHSRVANVSPLRVLRKLKTGPCAVFYLVQEIIAYSSNFLEIEDSPTFSPATFGRFFALKCLLKDEKDQEVQYQESTILHSLPIHANVVTLWTTFEISSHLLLVLDYVHGETLFHFLEQQRGYETTTSSMGGILQPLSYDRLRLVASIFTQMCDAVAHCHRNQVSHRDIKPESFMITEERVYSTSSGQYERKFAVKLIEFGLATRDVYSGDRDCGSAPYMSFECKNSLKSTYATGPADVWSLGVVLINLLYHSNPWTTTAIGQCPSFEYFLREPINFFMGQFDGLTRPVAGFLARNVFCLLKPPMPLDVEDDASNPAVYSGNIGRRITIEQFTIWARDLVLHLGPSARRTAASAFQRRSDPENGLHSIVYTALTRSSPEVNRFIPSVSQPATHSVILPHTRPSVHTYTSLVAKTRLNNVATNFDNDNSDQQRPRAESRKRKEPTPRRTSRTSQPTDRLSSAAEYAAGIRAGADTSSVSSLASPPLGEEPDFVDLTSSFMLKQPIRDTALRRSHLGRRSSSVLMVPSITKPSSAQQLTKEQLERLQAIIKEVEDAPIVLGTERSETHLRGVQAISSYLESPDEEKEDLEANGNEEYSPPSSIASSPCSSPGNLPAPLPEESAPYNSTDPIMADQVGFAEFLMHESFLPGDETRSELSGMTSLECSTEGSMHAISATSPESSVLAAEDAVPGNIRMRPLHALSLDIDASHKHLTIPRPKERRKLVTPTVEADEGQPTIRPSVDSRPWTAPRTARKIIRHKIRERDDISVISLQTTSTSSTAKGVSVTVTTPTGPRDVYKLRASE